MKNNRHYVTGVLVLLAIALPDAARGSEADRYNRALALLGHPSCEKAIAEQQTRRRRGLREAQARLIAEENLEAKVDFRVLQDSPKFACWMLLDNDLYAKGNNHDLMQAALVKLPESQILPGLSGQESTLGHMITVGNLKAVLQTNAHFGEWALRHIKDADHRFLRGYNSDATVVRALKLQDLIDSKAISMKTLSRLEDTNCEVQNVNIRTPYHTSFSTYTQAHKSGTTVVSVVGTGSEVRSEQIIHKVPQGYSVVLAEMIADKRAKEETIQETISAVNLCPRYAEAEHKLTKLILDAEKGLFSPKAYGFLRELRCKSGARFDLSPIMETLAYEYTAGKIDMKVLADTYVEFCDWEVAARAARRKPSVTVDDNSAGAVPAH